MAYIENMRNAHNTCQFMCQSTIQIEQTTQILQPQSEEIQVLKRTHIFVCGFFLRWIFSYLASRLFDLIQYLLDIYRHRCLYFACKS